MKIITCIKQVPASSNVGVDKETGVLIRDGNNVKMNPYDLFNLEAAFTLKESSQEALVHAISMGPPQALEVLKEALYMGADEATLISDIKFAGADVLATSYTLSELIKQLGKYDVIVCGKQTTDGDTAQVGPEIAEFLKIPHVPYVKEIIKVEKDKLTLRSGYDDYEEIVAVKLPCLITIEKETNTPRLPSFRRRLLKEDYQIAIKSLQDLNDKNPKNYGLLGSPTQVEEIFPPAKSSAGEIIKGKKEEVVESLINILKERRYL